VSKGCGIRILARYLSRMYGYTATKVGASV